MMKPDIKTIIELLDNLTYFKNKMVALGLRTKEPTTIVINKKLKTSSDSLTINKKTRSF